MAESSKLTLSPILVFMLFLSLHAFCRPSHMSGRKIWMNFEAHQRFDFEAIFKIFGRAIF